MVPGSLLGHSSDGGPEVDRLDRRAGGVRTHPLGHPVGSLEEEVVDARARLTTAQLRGVHRPWDRLVGPFDHVPPVGVDLVLQVLGDPRPVPFRVVGDQALDATGHPAHGGVVAGHDQRVAVVRPHLGVGGQQAGAETAGTPGTLRAEVAQPQRDGILHRPRGHPAVRPQRAERLGPGHRSGRTASPATRRTGRTRACDSRRPVRRRAGRSRSGRPGLPLRRAGPDDAAARPGRQSRAAPGSFAPRPPRRR